ncbi:hypothetical protein D9599_26680 [Roseomonas sp. KE2513]|nr:hypothetical protein [Roseomonas sp. KE2513]
MIREHLMSQARSIGQSITHYVPVWLFLAQDCAPFSIGPVRFIRREDWLGAITARRGKESSWMPGVRVLWAGRRLKGGSWLAGIRASVRAFAKAPVHPSAWAHAFTAARRHSEPKDTFHARTIARQIRTDQWIACVEVDGFEREESRRRGLLATRVALDTIRLVLDGTHRRLVSTAADSVVPFSVERLSQVAGEDLAHGWRINRPGVSGAPGLAQSIVDASRPVFDAAGICLAASATLSPIHPCPKLAEKWFNAAHWFGRACLADVDFVAVVMLVIALDVLCGGREERGILELVCRLTDTPASTPVLPDGTKLGQLVKRGYKLRSEVAHGSILAVHQSLDGERAQLESLAAAAIAEYAVELQKYSQSGGADDRDAFLASLPQMQT